MKVDEIVRAHYVASRAMDNTGSDDRTRILDVERVKVGTDRGSYNQIRVRAGRVKTEVVGAGSPYQFSRDVWPVDVLVSVSPTGRSVRVWINHEEIEL